LGLLVHPLERGTTPSLDTTPGGLATSGVHLDGTAGSPLRRRAATLLGGATERSGSCVGRDLLETGSESLDGVEVCTLTALLDPQAADSGSGNREQDN
jgi:hypothetical protein